MVIFHGYVTNNQMLCFAALPKVLLNMSIGIPPDKGKFLSWTPYVIMTFFLSKVHRPSSLRAQTAPENLLAISAMNKYMTNQHHTSFIHDIGGCLFMVFPLLLVIWLQTPSWLVKYPVDNHMPTIKKNPFSDLYPGVNYYNI